MNQLLVERCFKLKKSNFSRIIICFFYYLVYTLINGTTQYIFYQYIISIKILYIPRAIVSKPIEVFEDIINLENMKKPTTFQCVLVQSKKYLFQKRTDQGTWRSIKYNIWTLIIPGDILNITYMNADPTWRYIKYNIWTLIIPGDILNITFDHWSYQEIY